MKFLSHIIVFITLICSSLNAQTSKLFHQIDTIKYGENTGGLKIDSMDLYHAGIGTLQAGFTQASVFGRFQHEYSQFYNRFSSPFLPTNRLKTKFSALPHLGFAYSFGSSNMQFVHVDYQHVLNKNNQIHFVYNRSSIGNLLRNGETKNDDIAFAWDANYKNYEQHFSFSFLKSVRGQNGGISNFDVFETQGISFSPVFKELAQSTNKQLKIINEHYWQINKDSISKFGLTFQHELSLLNRVYTENDFLPAIYNVINIDSLSTRDQYQASNYHSGAGVYFKNNRFKSEFLLQSRYRGFQNLGSFKDTLETFAQFSAELKLEKFKLSHHTSTNITGARGELFSKSTISTKMKKIRQQAEFIIDRKLPSMFQRTYFANNHSWNLTSLSPQNHFDLSYHAHYQSKFSVDFQTKLHSYNNQYTYVNGNWRNDTLSNWSYWSTSLRANFSLKTLHIQPSIIFNQHLAGVNILPQLDTRTRVFFNKKLFKARKFDFMAGVDVRHLSSYQLMTYEPSLDVFRLDNGLNISSESRLRLDVFTGFQIEEFRFYFRIENIDSFWNRSPILEFNHIPIAPTLFRIGISWDFFN